MAALLLTADISHGRLRPGMGILGVLLLTANISHGCLDIVGGLVV